MEIVSLLVPKIRLDEILHSNLSTTVALSSLVADMEILTLTNHKLPSLNQSMA
jgi:hypothetical protein